jgi:hypothetical protein
VRRRRGGLGEEERGGVEGGDRLEVCECEELGLTVAALDLAFHGGEHLLTLASDLAADRRDSCLRLCAVEDSASSGSWPPPPPPPPANSKARERRRRRMGRGEATAKVRHIFFAIILFMLQ